MENYEILRTLGEGGYGKALLVKRKKDNLLCVAKSIKLANLKENEKKESLREVSVLAALRHPNIVSYIESFTQKGILYIIMEYADGGDLSKKIERQNKKPFSEDEILDIFTQLALAIKYIHDRKILHRDLKGQNVFLTKDGRVKLGDFGIAKVLDYTAQFCKTQIGTPYYLSPEICEGKRYDSKTDIWSLGCILYEMCTLRHAFDGRNINNLLINIVRGKFQPISSIYSPELRQLVKSLLQKDPKLRPSANQIVLNPIIRSRVSSFLSEVEEKREMEHTVLHGRSPLQRSLRREDLPPNLAPIPEERTPPIIRQPRSNISNQNQIKNQAQPIIKKPQVKNDLNRAQKELQREMPISARKTNENEKKRLEELEERKRIIEARQNKPESPSIVRRKAEDAQKVMDREARMREKYQLMNNNQMKNNNQQQQSYIDKNKEKGDYEKRKMELEKFQRQAEEKERLRNQDRMKQILLEEERKKKEENLLLERRKKEMQKRIMEEEKRQKEEEKRRAMEKRRIDMQREKEMREQMKRENELKRQQEYLEQQRKKLEMEQKKHQEHLQYEKKLQEQKQQLKAQFEEREKQKEEQRQNARKIAEQKWIQAAEEAKKEKQKKFEQKQKNSIETDLENNMPKAVFGKNNIIHTPRKPMSPQHRNRVPRTPPLLNKQPKKVKEPKQSPLVVQQSPRVKVKQSPLNVQVQASPPQKSPCYADDVPGLTETFISGSPPPPSWARNQILSEAEQLQKQIEEKRVQQIFQEAHKQPQTPEKAPIQVPPPVQVSVPPSLPVPSVQNQKQQQQIQINQQKQQPIQINQNQRQQQQIQVNQKQQQQPPLQVKKQKPQPPSKAKGRSSPKKKSRNSKRGNGNKFSNDEIAESLRSALNADKAEDNYVAGEPSKMFLGEKEVMLPVANDIESMMSRAEEIRSLLIDRIGVDKVLALRKELLGMSPPEQASKIDFATFLMMQQLLYLDECIENNV